MKRILLSLTCLLFLAVLSSNASAGQTAVVYKPGTSPCTSGDVYKNTISSGISAASNWGTVIVCPGTYVENVNVGYRYISVISYSQDPTDTIIQAADPNNEAVYIMNYHYILGAGSSYISGFTITGATGSSCNNGYDTQPCAGIRVYCTWSGTITNNIITGNNYGIIIKDTDPDWVFGFTIKNNIIRSNNVGIKFHYGHYSYIWDNKIYNNSTGVLFIDTWGNEIIGNLVESNSLGIELTSSAYPAGQATRNNNIYHNDIIDNTAQTSDNAPCTTSGYNHYWYSTSLLEGNFWSDYTGIDTNGDGIGDTNVPHPISCSDYYPFISSIFLEDSDLDGTPDDGDGSGTIGDNPCTGGNTLNCDDNCMYAYNPVQADIDSDGIGNVCDDDNDNDSILNDADGSGTIGDNPCTNGNTLNCDDNCEYNYNPVQADFDSDGIGDTCDADNDNDGLTDYEEGVFGTDPFNPDTDGDGVDDLNDAFPLDSNETVDSDKREIQITTDPSLQYYPAISGNRIVWQDSRNGNWDIYMCELTPAGTCIEKQITTDSSDQLNPSISGNRIVWNDKRNGNTNIYTCELAPDGTCTETRITTDSSSYGNQPVSGNRIVWAEYRYIIQDIDTSDIYMYDFSTGQVIPITTHPAGQMYPSISGNRIVFERNWKIYMYDFQDRQETWIGSFTDSPGSRPDISGNYVVWIDLYDQGGIRTDILVYDIDADETTVVVSGVETYAGDAKISGNRIVWMDYRNGNYDMFMYDISTGQETQITSESSSNQSSPDIFRDRIVWMDNRNGNRDIYMYAGDGMPDNWELQYGLDPNNPDDGAYDIDSDGLTNLQEYLAGTDPTDDDTDNDGIKDGDDVCPALAPVKINSTYYTSFQTTYDSAENGDTIESQAVTLIENMVFNQDITVNMEAGYDCDFITNTGTTILKGEMRVQNGTLILESGTLIIE